MKIENIIERVQLRRKTQGIAAALIHSDVDGKITFETFQTHIQATHHAGLMNAVNMDTAYANYLSAEEKREVLRWTRQALGYGVPFVAGAYIEGRHGDIISLYCEQMDEIVAQ